jgi:hypothetical protein
MVDFNELKIPAALSPARSVNIGDDWLQPYAGDLDGQARPRRLRDF